MRRAHSRPLIGLAAIGVVAGLVALSIATYAKALPWQQAASVTIRTLAPGLELNPRSDVKLQGKRVGEVRAITTEGRTATIELAIDEDDLALIPANVDAAIVPKTLFGEKYVDLRPPADPSATRLTDGGVIRQSTTSVEIGQLFSRLVPVLEALHPEQLSTVLGSLAQALDGRGKQLGATLTRLDTFLRGIEPRLGTLTHDLRQLATTADVYTRTAPDLKRVLAASTGLSRGLLVPHEQRFAAALASAIGTSATAEAVLAENTERLVSLTGRSEEVLAVLDTYAENLPCIMSALHRGNILVNQTTGALGPFANLTIDMITHQEPYKYPDDLPSNPKSDAHNSNLPRQVPSWAPHCTEFTSYALQLENALPYSQELPSPTGGRGGTAASASGGSVALTEARRALARTMAARLLGSTPEDVPAYVGVLMDPLFSTGEVAIP